MFLPKKILLASICSCLAVSTVIALPFTFFTSSVQAQSRRVRYNPPSNLDAPTVSASGITRSAGCAYACLIALMPDLKQENKPIPQTISERPTIYFLTPEFNGSVQFILYEDNVVPAKPKPESGLPASSKKQIYEKSFAISNNAGIIAMKMPDEAPILEVGKNYTWKFIVKGKTIEGYKVVQGKMRRVLPTKNLVTQLPTISKPLERAALFAQEGIWFEAVQALADAQLTVPTNTEALEEWTSLLKSAKLDRVLPFTFVTQKQSLKR
jgi:hypothetical protein